MSGLSVSALLGLSSLLGLFCGMAMSQGICSTYPGYIVLTNMHGLGGTSNTATTTLSDCQLSCTNDVTCQSFDWDPNNPNGQVCWVIPYSAGNNVLPSIGATVTHYTKNASCISAATTRITTPAYVASQSFSAPTGSGSFQTAPTTTPTGSGSVQTSPTTTPTGSGSVQTSPTTTPYGNGSVQAAPNTNPVNAFAIKPAYIVLAGLGAGCILLVLIAICVICCYPMGGAGARHKTTHQKAPRASIHTHQPVVAGTMRDHTKDRESIPMQEHAPTSHVEEYGHANGTGVTYVSEDNHIDDNHHNNRVDDNPHITHIGDDHHITNIEDVMNDREVEEKHHTHTPGDVEDNPYYSGDDDKEKPTEGYDY